MWPPLTSTFSSLFSKFWKVETKTSGLIDRISLSELTFESTILFGFGESIFYLKNPPYVKITWAEVWWTWWPHFLVTNFWPNFVFCQFWTFLYVWAGAPSRWKYKSQYPYFCKSFETNHEAYLGNCIDLPCSKKSTIHKP